MVYTLTLNPSLDYMIYLKEFQTAKINRSHEEAIFPGGKGINVTRMLHALGCETVAYGFIGGFSGMEIKRLLEEKGIKTDFVLLQGKNSRINVKLCAKEETEVNCQGPEITDEEIKALDEKIGHIENGQILVLSGTIPQSIKNSYYAGIMEKTAEKNLRVVVDTTGDSLKETLKYNPYLIKPNQYELGDLFGVEITTKQEAVNYAQKLQDMGAKNVLVSLGKDGAILLTEKREYFEMNAPQGKVISTVGSGDCMVAGFLYGYERYKDYKIALEYAISAGSANAFTKGTATKEQIEILRKERMKL